MRYDNYKLGTFQTVLFILILLLNCTEAQTCPVPFDDAATTLQGNPVVIDVRANDENNNGATICNVQSPTDNGGTAVVSSGKMTYTPATGFCGPDTFTYKLCKPGCEPSKNAIVTVDIICECGL